MVRNLPSGQVQERARSWAAAIERSTAIRPLLDLYRGESWSQVKRLISTATQVGYEPEVLVASAGLGLRSVHDSAPAYAATFGAGHADSVANSTPEAQTWWAALPRTQLPSSAPAIWVLSETYSRVIGRDLIQTFASDELLVFGGSSEIPGEIRIAADRSLRRALGGTVATLNVRAATQWLLLSEGSNPFGQQARGTWRAWADRERHREDYNRSPLSDEAVVDFVLALRQRQPDVSKTRALRALRDSGMACEQQRFSLLFSKAVAR